jgi:hypothetical protein
MILGFFNALLNFFNLISFKIIIIYIDFILNINFLKFKDPKNCFDYKPYYIDYLNFDLTNVNHQTFQIFIIIFYLINYLKIYHHMQTINFPIIFAFFLHLLI